MRLIFTDESGNSAREPVFVVASIVIDADSQWKLIAERLTNLAVQYVPPERSKGFIFHASDLFAGKALGPNEGRGKNLELLQKIISITEDFSIPIAYGYHYKHSIDQKTSRSTENISHFTSFSHSISRCDSYIYEFCPGEIGKIIAENIPERHKLLRMVPDYINSIDTEKKPFWKDLVPLKSIHGSIVFAAKQEESLLQIADALAWTARRYLAGYDDVEHFLPRNENGTFLAEHRTGKTGGGTILIPARKFETNLSFKI